MRKTATTEARHGGVPPGTLMALMFAVFTVAAGYGLLLPLLPFLIERLLGPGATGGMISRHTGLLTSVYTLAIFLFAPFWGWLSDRYGRRRILVLGLLGFGASMLVFSLIESLPAVYAERFVSGMFAAAVSPVASATVGDLALSEEVRARRLTFVSLAGVSGILLGPMLGVYISRYAALSPAVAGNRGAACGAADRRCNPRADCCCYCREQHHQGSDGACVTQQARRCRGWQSSGGSQTPRPCVHRRGWHWCL